MSSMGVANLTPKVSVIILQELNLAGEEMVAICNINGFRPKAVDICWYMEKSDQVAGNGGSTDDPLLQATDITRHATHLVSKHGSLFNATSRLSYTPSVQDDSARLVCAVRHKALGAAARQESHVNVAARPKKSYITSWPQDPRMGGKLTLSCIVERFYPKPIKITWLRNGQVQSGATQFGPFPCEDDYYSVWSQIDLTVTEEEVGVMYTCQINHISLRGIEELSYEVNAQGTPPEVQFISADPVTPIIGKELLLSCRINNFFPRDIMVDWSKDGVRLEAGVCHSLCVTTTSGVHSMWSFLTITPAAEDDGAVFTCSVQHTALKHPEERTYTLSVPAQNHSI
ncbi:LOW QUALITY PROTEIN: tyrosine-protein phosphatase non-receptor type substrate 1-like [Anomaloglossus baeobatrachus]